MQSSFSQFQLTDQDTLNQNLCGSASNSRTQLCATEHSSPTPTIFSHRRPAKKTKKPPSNFTHSTSLMSIGSHTPKSQEEQQLGQIHISLMLAGGHPPAASNLLQTESSEQNFQNYYSTQRKF